MGLEGEDLEGREFLFFRRVCIVDFLKFLGGVGGGDSEFSEWFEFSSKWGSSLLLVSERFESALSSVSRLEKEFELMDSALSSQSDAGLISCFTIGWSNSNISEIINYIKIIFN